ncbi:MAG TPA: hypothetical protein H9770_06895 [Candidatus Fournierella excrementigallinarum]|nr:hypothetical protein [Candidatus Fournierella excrementigallinarum]
MAWGELFGLLAMLAALFGMSAVLARRAGVGSAAAPLAALALAELVLLASGLLGVLRPAGLALAALGLLGGGLEAALAKKKGETCPLAAALESPAAKLFWAAALALAVGLWLLRPEFLNFDEYSFWGTAAKLTCENDALYTVCETGLPWQMTELAALPLASYFFQLFGPFAPWRAIFAADLLMLAALAAAAGCAKRARLACPLFLAGLSLPTLVTVAGHTALLNTAWLEFLGDLPAGMLFGGAAAFWLAVRDEGPAARWLTLPVLMLAANVKSNTFVLGLAAAGLVALDAALFAPGEKRGAKGFAARLGFGAACLTAPAAQYLLWNNYIAGLVRRNAAAGGMGDTASASLPAVVANGLKLLLGLPAESYFEARSEIFWQYGSAMTDAFWHRKVSVFGAGAAVAALTLAVFLAAVLLAAGKRARLRAALFAVGSSACFAGYWLMLWLSYAFLLKDSTPENLASYPRYFASYYTGWLLLALAVLAVSCASAKRPALGRAAALAVGAAFAAALAAGTEPQFTLLGVGGGEYAPVRQELAVAKAAKAAIRPGQKVFLIHQGDEGFSWFLFNQQLCPALVYGEGGATYGEPALVEGMPYSAPYTEEEFSALLKAEQVDLLLVSRVNGIFEESYAALFTDGLAAAKQGPALYEKSEAGWTPAASLAGEVTG